MPKSRIPRLIHRIWLGKPIPDRLEEWWATWSEKNPEWTCQTWRETELEALIEDSVADPGLLMA